VGHHLVKPLSKILPPSIQAGATLNHCVALADYPAPEWTLVVHLRGPAVINLAAQAGGASHQLLKTAAETAPFTPGVYVYAARVTRVADGTVEQVDAGQVEVLADLAAVTAPSDTRTHAQRTLDAIQAVIEKRASRDQERYTINNRELWRTPIADLLKLRDTYRAEVGRERAKARGKNLWGPAAQVRF
jgi:hypothetical protein